MENQLVTILRISTPQLGSFVKDKLEQQGIEVFFTDEGLTSDERYNPDEVLLKVKARQSEKAIAELLQLHKEYDLDKVKDDASFTNMKKILFPVKLSEDCMNLCQYAIRLAIKENAEIKVLYVYPDPNFNHPSRYTASWEKYVRMELREAHEKAEQKLVNFSKELKKQVPPELFNAVKIHYRMLKGTPENVITAACKRYNPDLILMGTKAKKSVDGEFLGKTLINVIEQTHHSVLAVPLSAVFKGKEQINVMYSTDFYDADKSSLNKLLKTLKPFKKKIYCVHFDMNNAQKQQEKVNELNAMLDKDYSEYHIRSEFFESKDLIKGIEEFVANKDIDIISLSKVKHSGFYKLFHTDLVSTLMAKTNVPILIFPVSQEKEMPQLAH
ncbi:universal stress protein [Draconibacterium halophilum]|uniref:Universal stress protein n=1 Tax=Draconibacterium halophilum TaxID=2706887 RepID=A0A6C0RCA5_9BACT|nr:universal stress protein [Draconibacterium halophilum]QIA07739.1 universal stress protein [Draconibacterium halophilum]